VQVLHDSPRDRSAHNAHGFFINTTKILTSGCPSGQNGAFSLAFASRQQQCPSHGQLGLVGAPAAMYAHRSFAHSASVKDAFLQDPDHVSGLSSDGAYAWLAAGARLSIWRASDGSYAAITTLACPSAWSYSNRDMYDGSYACCKTCWQSTSDVRCDNMRAIEQAQSAAGPTKPPSSFTPAAGSSGRSRGPSRRSLRFACAGPAQYVHVLPYANNGPLTVVACSADGTAAIWLDVNVQTTPLVARLAPSEPGAASCAVLACDACALQGPDAPGAVGAVALSSGRLVVFSAVQGRIAQRGVAPAGTPVTTTGALRRFGSAVVKPSETASWMSAMAGPEARGWWVNKAVAKTLQDVFLRQSVERASAAPARDILVQHKVRTCTAGPKAPVDTGAAADASRCIAMAAASSCCLLLLRSSVGSKAPVAMPWLRISCLLYPLAHDVDGCLVLPQVRPPMRAPCAAAAWR
jgi:hypothetical protein